MKTLDEVTKALSICGRHPNCKGCPYENISYPTEIGNTCKDIMHYDALYYMQPRIDKYQEANVPLTWDELKTMEGKPVFLEQYWYPMEDEEGVTEDEVEIDKYWAIIDNVQAKRIHFVGKRLIMGMTISDLDPNKSGGWQAFRRERE